MFMTISRNPRSSTSRLGFTNHKPADLPPYNPTSLVPSARSQKALVLSELGCGSSLQIDMRLGP